MVQLLIDRSMARKSNGCVGLQAVRESRLKVHGVRPIRLLLGIIVGGLIGFGAARAHASAPYQGIYVISDPYNLSQALQLKQAGQTPCPTNGQTPTTPFCGAADGVLLRVAWCDFQLNHLTDAQHNRYPSCHYTVGFTNGNNSAGAVVPNVGTVSQCFGSYDTCAGKSTLGTALRYISQINVQRANAGLAPLKIGLGLFAGIGTPQGVLDAVGYVDVPYNTSAPGFADNWQCYRMPLAWKTQFTDQYNSAVDQLVTYVQSQFPAGANITYLKVANITARDFEIAMPGQTVAVPSPQDPSAGGPGPAMNCSPTAIGARVWLNAYNNAPLPSQNFSQANETAFASAIGHAYGLLLNSGLPNAALSLAITNSRTFAGVDCGINGASVCNTTGTGNWTDYYLEYYVNDLFNGGLAYQSALAAYNAIRTDTFSLPPAKVLIDWTGLAQAPIVATGQMECHLNNTIPAYAPRYVLDKQTVTVIGSATGLAWQTATNLGTTCSTNAYAQTLSNGIQSGGLFIEVEPDAAFTNLVQCNAPLSNALTQILALTPPTTCSY